MSRVIAAVDRLDRSLTALSPVVVTAFGAFSLYYVAFSYGLFVVALAGGKRGITGVVASSGSSPGLVLICLPLIPVGLVLLEAADLEGRGLVYWRAKVSPVLSRIPVLGKVINYMWPTPPREPYVSQPSGLSSSIDFLARSVTGGLMLPLVAYYIGRSMFKKAGSVQRIMLVSKINGIVGHVMFAQQDVYQFLFHFLSKSVS